MATLMQAAQLNMFQTVDNQVKSNSEVFIAIPGFKERYDEYSENLARMYGLNEVLTTDKSGASTELTRLKTDLIDSAFSVASKVTAFALIGRNTTLYNEMNYSKSDLRKNSYQNLISICETIYNRGLALLTELTKFKVTSEMLNGLKDLLEKCRQAVPMPRESINQQSNSVKSMSQLLKTNTLLLNEMDTLAEVIRESDPQIYEAYMKARKTVKPPMHRKAVVGKISNSGGSIPVKGATVSFYLIADNAKNGVAANGSVVSEKPLLTKITAEAGGFKVDNLPEGMYRVEVIKNGYQSKELIVAINNKETTKIEVELMKG